MLEIDSGLSFFDCLEFPGNVPGTSGHPGSSLSMSEHAHEELSLGETYYDENNRHT